MIAVQCNDIEMAKILLEYGVDLNKRIEKRDLTDEYVLEEYEQYIGFTALDFSQVYGYKDIERLLKQAGAK